VPDANGAPPPLAGRRVLLTRPREQSEALADRVRALGGEPVVCPLVATVPPDDWREVDDALERIADAYEWIAFTSAAAVRALCGRAESLGVGIPARVRLAVVGPGTGRALEEALRPADLVASTHIADTLADEMPHVSGARVLFPKSEIARETLPRALRERGALVDEVVVYRTVPGDGVADFVRLVRDGGADAILLASGSAARVAADALAEGGVPAAGGDGRPAVFCIGPVTERAAREAGFLPAATADAFTAEGLMDAMARWYRARVQERES
jgi:uroporphyrinogen-III synthase